MVLPALERIICGGTVVTPAGRQIADIGIAGGRIATLAVPGSLTGGEVVDVTGCHVLPGIIDPHVHFRTPGHPHKEDPGSGAMAAACGGVTLVCEMPSTSPPVVTAAALAEKRALFAGQSWVDFALWGMVLEDGGERVAELARAGAMGIKVFMASSSSGRPPVDDGRLFSTFQAAAAAGLTVGVHAENHDVIRLLTERLRAAGRHDLLAHGEARPAFAEAEAIGRAVALAAATGCRLHIVHLSTAAGLAALSQAKARGVAVTCETCPQYLYFTQADVERVGPYALMNPPLRHATDLAALQAALGGAVDCIATDHAPHQAHEKVRPSVWEVPGGTPGVETSLPLLLNLVHDGRLTLERLAALMSENVARCFGLYPRKGAIMVGSDADLTVVDLARRETIRPERMHSKVRDSLFTGVTVQGWPVLTVVRGQVVMREGTMVGEPAGQFVPGPATVR